MSGFTWCSTMKSVSSFFSKKLRSEWKIIIGPSLSHCWPSKHIISKFPCMLNHLLMLSVSSYYFVLCYKLGSSVLVWASYLLADFCSFSFYPAVVLQFASLSFLFAHLNMLGTLIGSWRAEYSSSVAKPCFLILQFIFYNITIRNDITAPQPQSFRN